MVKITPNYLKFKAPFTQSSTEYLKVTNDSDYQIAFKVKTTAPKLYCVRPNSHNVMPGESIDVSVIFLGLKQEPEPTFKCNDKFLIVSLPCPYDLEDKPASEVWPDLEREFKHQSESKKIKVTWAFPEPEVNPEPLAESSQAERIGESITEESFRPQHLEQEAYPDEYAAQLSRHEVQESLPKSSNKTNSVSPTLAQITIDPSKVHIIERPAQEEYAEEKLKIESLEEKFDAGSEKKVVPSKQTDTAARPMTTTTVILFAFIAFIIGWLFF